MSFINKCMIKYYNCIPLHGISVPLRICKLNSTNRNKSIGKQNVLIIWNLLTSIVFLQSQSQQVYKYIYLFNLNNSFCCFELVLSKCMLIQYQTRFHKIHTSEVQEFSRLISAICFAYHKLWKQATSLATL